MQSAPPPAKRPPSLPWYWQTAISILAFVALICGVTAAIVWGEILVIPSESDYRYRAYVSELLGAADTVKQEVNSQGCRPGSRPPPHAKIAVIEVSDTGAGRCTVTATLGQFQGKAAVLNGGKISLTRKQDGDWTCASDLPNKYLPTQCRH